MHLESLGCNAKVRVHNRLQKVKHWIRACLCITTSCFASGAIALHLEHGDTLCSNYDDRDDTCSSIAHVVIGDGGVVTMNILSGASDDQGQKYSTAMVGTYDLRGITMCSTSFEATSIEVEETRTEHDKKRLLTRLNQAQKQLTERGLCWTYYECSGNYFGIAKLGGQPAPFFNTFFKVFREGDEKKIGLTIRHELVNGQPRNPVLPTACVPHS